MICFAFVGGLFGPPTASSIDWGSSIVKFFCKKLDIRPLSDVGVGFFEVVRPGAIDAQQLALPPDAEVRMAPFHQCPKIF